MANNYIPLAMRPHVLSIAFLRAAHDDVLSRVASMEARIAVQDRIIEQLLMGEKMAKTYQQEIEANPLKKAYDAGRKAAMAGAGRVVPVDIAQTPLQTRAWLRGFSEGEGERKAG
jgi:hypothetical protein